MSRLRIGIAGMGSAGQAFIPALHRHPAFEWVAMAEPLESLRQSMQQRHGVAAYASLAEMLDHDGIEAVCIATPTPLHAEQSCLAADSGKHVLVEKPMAVTLDEARSMIAAAEQAGVVLQVGHSHSYDAPIAAMREIIESGELGPVRMAHNWCYTDWMRRPRRADELDAAQGGGVTFRQGAHQFDVLRLLCGGRARSVKARSFDWDPKRRGIGAHTVFIDFEDGAVATAVYNGYGGFASSELGGDVGEWGQRLSAPSRRPGFESPEAELAAKQARAASAIPSQAPHQPFFGLTLVSCERGDIRQSPDGLRVYGEEGPREIELPRDRSPRQRVLDEFARAVRRDKPALHDGRWGLANLEVCLAAMESSRSGAEVLLREQPGVRSH